MLHLLLIVLAVLAIWRLLAGASRPTGQTLERGLKRLGLVAAVLAAALGGAIGQSGGGGAGGLVVGALASFLAVQTATWVLVRIARGFLG